SYAWDARGVGAFFRFLDGSSVGSVPGPGAAACCMQATCQSLGKRIGAGHTGGQSGVDLRVPLGYRDFARDHLMMGHMATMALLGICAVLGRVPAAEETRPGE